MKTLPVPSALELAILGLIGAGAKSGYEVRRRLAASPGAVYPALARLQRAGLISGRELTALGRRVLRDARGRHRQGRSQTEPRCRRVPAALSQ
jgi:DNA-binding PadR family transcriptional regulator